MNKIALFVLYNHKYTKNIKKIESIYFGRFSHIYHLMPFYEGDIENVIPVYETSIQFQSYISQAYQKVKKENFTHYFVVADDMILNPCINENNLFSEIGLKENSSFITDLRDNKSYPYDVPLFENITGWGIEVKDVLPPKNDACKFFDNYGLHYLPNLKFIIKYIFRNILHRDFKKCKHALIYLRNKNKDTIYPALWGYSDIVIVPSNAMEKFTTYCGAFAGLNIFVEQAIPISLVLSSSSITLGKDLTKKYIAQLYSLGIKGESEFIRTYNNDLKTLLDNFPKDLFFVHPIKLSQWNA